MSEKSKPLLVDTRHIEVSVTLSEQLTDKQLDAIVDTLDEIGFNDIIKQKIVEKCPELEPHLVIKSDR